MLVFGTSCASYVNRMHKEIDSKDEQKFRPSSRDSFLLYQKRNGGQLKSLTTKEVNNLKPGTQRQYTKSKKRYSANDLLDNDDSGSLWAGRGQESFLFSKNNYKRNGDIVIIQVQGNLKSAISAELARAFPATPKPRLANSNNAGDEIKDGKRPAAANNIKSPPPVEENPSSGAKEDPTKVYDRISSIVLEEVNKDHLLVRGRKELLYKRNKRVVEIQALVARRDVEDNDTIMSKHIIESDVHVLR